MNAKLCKRLRARALGKTLGAPARGYVLVQQRRRPHDPPLPTTEGVANAPGTTRFAYHAAKRAVRQGRFPIRQVANARG